MLAYLDRRLVSSMGSIKDDDGGFAIDYVEASEVGAPMLAEAGAVWSDELESSLDDWVERRQECTFQEWVRRRCLSFVRLCFERLRVVHGLSREISCALREF